MKDFKEAYENLPLETAEELYENAPCGYISFLADGTIVMINRTLLSWLGYEKNEILYVKKFQGLLNIGGKIFFETHFSPLIKMQGFVNQINFDFVRKDKSIFPVLINVNEFVTSKGSQHVYRGTIFDITERKRYEKELLDARKRAEGVARSKAEFLATISHEIRTPLNAIIGIANLIHNTPLNDQQKEYARILKLSSDGLLGLVNDVLDFTKIEKGKVKLEEKAFSLKEIAITLVHTLEIKAQEKGIQLKAKLDKSLPDFLVGDPLKLNQILTNLLGNAIKFTSQGFVRLEISVISKEEDKALINFKVVDTGIGIPQDRLEAIFEEFSQASDDVNVTYGGTGLGLTISQKLLQLHGSKIEVSSKEGKGSTFSFSINYSISKEAPLKEFVDNTHAELSRLPNARILVVDDVPLNVTIVQEYLQGWGMRADAANNGEKALELVQQHVYDLIIMDLQMPGMNGFQSTEAIRKLILPKQPAIIALSASARGDISERLKLSGFNEYLPKPFNPHDLYKAIVRQIGRLEKEENQDTAVVIPEGANKGIVDDGQAEKDTQPFDLTYYIELTGKVDGAFEKVMKITINSFERFKKEFTAVIQEKNITAIAGLVHKIEMPIHYIQAADLKKSILAVRELIRQEDSEDRLIEAKLSELNAEFDKVIMGLKSLSNKS